MLVTALVPIKKYSSRLKDKNFLPFCGKPLYQVILEKLQEIDLISFIVINTDSEIIANECVAKYSKVVIIKRADAISSNDITMNTIIKHDLPSIEGEHFLQTHCTNPLLSKKTIITAIENYFDKLNEYDSLLTVDCIKKRVYDKDYKPINHRNEVLEQTQHLPEIFIENSNLFIFSRTSFYNAACSRVGQKPQMLVMNSIESIDIDNEDDFLLAESITQKQKFI